MVLSGKMEKGLKGKGRSAFRNLRAVEDNCDDIIKILGKIASKLKCIIEKISPKTEENENQEKCMSEIDNIPKRIEFNLVHLKFYIDFTLIMPEKDDRAEVKGCIIYGAHKSVCFADCIYPKTSCKEIDKRCERISRCDGLEDKPLIQFSVDRNGMIQAEGEIEDKWWIKKIEQDEKDTEDKEELKEERELLEEILSDLHLRTMEIIWPKALTWTNENLLA